MRSASQCREQATECRVLARDFEGEHRQQLLEMAETWDDLARRMDSANNRHLAGMIQAIYDKVANEPVPDRFRELLRRLDAMDSRGR